MKIRSFSSGVFFLFFLPFLLISPFVSHAQLTGPPATDAPPTTIKLTNPIKGVDTIVEFLKIILTAVIKIGIPLVVLAIIYSGFLFVTAMGNTEKLGKAKDALLWSLVGAAVLLGSWAIAEIIVVTVTKIK